MVGASEFVAEDGGVTPQESSLVGDAIDFFSGLPSLPPHLQIFELAYSRLPLLLKLILHH
ncbi:MAG TPA: hypothetical protein PLM33_14695 [Acidobacteriota bacterium]|nr:hypothetical protein [Acidobacteriota bacterium]